MLPFDEAIAVLKKYIEQYKIICMNAKHEIYSDTQAFFLNLIPIGQWHGGATGYQRALKLIADLDHYCADGTIKSTSELIAFGLVHPDQGGVLSKFIKVALRNMAGFTQAHIDFLAIRYAQTDGVIRSGIAGVTTPDYREEKCQHVAIKLINWAIRGHYKEKLKGYVPSEKLKEIFDSPHHYVWEVTIAELVYHKYDAGQMLLAAITEKLDFDLYEEPEKISNDECELNEFRSSSQMVRPN